MNGALFTTTNINTLQYNRNNQYLPREGHAKIFAYCNLYTAIHIPTWMYTEQVSHHALNVNNDLNETGNFYTSDF